MARLVAPLGPAIGIVLVLLLGSCAGPPPATPRERLAAAEISYQAALETVQQLHRAGKLDSAGKRDRVRMAIQAAHSGLESWRLSPDVADAAEGALAALRALQAILTELQGGTPT